MGPACVGAVPLLKSKARALLGAGEGTAGEAHPRGWSKLVLGGACFSPPPNRWSFTLTLTLVLSLRLGNKGEKLSCHHRPRGDGGPGPRWVWTAHACPECTLEMSHKDCLHGVQSQSPEPVCE